MGNKYFDNAATTKLDEKVFEKMIPYLKDNYGGDYIIINNIKFYAKPIYSVEYK